jgi:hypothetical protein
MVGRLGMDSLALTYFLTGSPQYHRRGPVSRSCSGWEGVVPGRYGHQTERGVTWGKGWLGARSRDLEEVRIGLRLLRELR